jgi:transketolase
VAASIQALTMTTDLHDLARQMRKSVIETSYSSHMGHIGSALSVIDILAVLYGEVLDESHGATRDRMILSKGHAALALYAALVATGRMPAEQLESFCTDGTALGAHPEHVVPGIDFSTGSLGHGLSLGAGAALGARLAKSDHRVFVVISDAELNEGSVWEAVMFAAHHRLSNLVAILDLNGQQALGYTRDVLDLQPVAERWRAFGWSVEEVDGHDLVKLSRSLSASADAEGRPRLVIADTTFGKGVSFMESRIEWHYLPLSEEQCEAALSELDVELAGSQRAGS